MSAALAAIRHRGPDGEGIAELRGATLGHCRLAVIDLTEAAAQPMFNDDRKVSVVFNGEIYNHHALRGELQARGHRFVSRSDTEVIVRGYEAWGEDVVAKLDGMFAFGIYDERKQALLLARDRAGKKPLFYARNGERFLFASEIKALSALGVPCVVNTQALPMLMFYGYVPPPQTMHQGVFQLPPAHFMWARSAASASPKRYWQAPFIEPSRAIQMPEAASEVRRLVEAAVKRRLQADVPLGAFLSGGVDSTIIVGVMSRLLGQRVKTFSIGFEGDARFDETHYARGVAAAFATDHTEFTLRPSSFDLVERLVDLHDGPFADSSAIPTSVVSMLTRQHVTVALSGDGGDELFCGYSRFLAAAAAERVPKSIRLLNRHLSEWLPSGARERSLYARAIRFWKSASLDLPERLAAWTSVFLDFTAFLRPELALEQGSPVAWNRAIFAPSRNVCVMRRILHANFETYLPNDLLLKADRASMGHALEVRSPFLDTELVEFASRLPPELLHRGRRTKLVLHRAFADLLPEAIKNRGKMGFGVPLGAWFRRELRAQVHDYLAPGARLYEFIEPEAARQLLVAHDQGRADHGHRLWLLLTLEVWLRSLRSPADAA